MSQLPQGVHPDPSVQESTVSILVVVDAGAASVDLLRARNLDVVWALTAPELEAVAGRGAQLMISRRELTSEALALAKAQKVPLIVALEGDEWSHQDKLLQAGVSALVEASDRSKMIEAVAELTGLALAAHPRVACEEFVSVDANGDSEYAKLVGLSRSGADIESERKLPLGQRVRVDVEFDGSAATVDGVVVRQSEGPDGHLLGVVWENTQSDLQEAIERTLHRAPSIEPPTSMTGDLGTCTLDLFIQAGQAPHLNPHRALLNSYLLKPEAQQRLPRWLKRFAIYLTAAERSAALNESVGDWAEEVLDSRLRLAEFAHGGVTAAELAEHGPRVLELSKTLSNEAPAELAPFVRGRMLSQVYRLKPKAADA